MDRLPAVHFVHFYSSPGGIEVLTSRIVRMMSTASFRIFVIRPGKPGATDVYEGTGVERTTGSTGNMKAFFLLWRYALRHRKDVFHLLNTGPFFLLAVRLAGTHRVVYGIHGTLYWNNKLQRLVRRLAWKLALLPGIKVTSNSAYSRKVFHDKISSRQEVTVLYNPVGCPGITRHDQDKDNELIRIIFAGRLSPGKNLERWIEIACEIHSLAKNTVFEIYGSGPLREPLLKKIEILQASGFISLMGFRKDLGAVYSQADLLLFLSEYESFGNVVVESILHGTPVLVSDIPSMREIFSAFPELILNSEGNTTEQVIEKLGDMERLKKIAVEARELFRERYSAESHIKALGTIYSSFYE
jgi:glycosyltransferase involved in cell wall biosynthesis